MHGYTPSKVCTRATIYPTVLSSMRAIIYQVVVSVRGMVVDENRPYKIVLLTPIASRGVTGLLSFMRNEHRTRADDKAVKLVLTPIQDP